MKLDEIISNKKELCIKHYYDEYHDPNYPPIWMIVETLSFGVCSKLFSNIKKISLRNKIAEQLGQHTTTLESWLQTLTYIRNICAHHSRLWNRWVVNPPLIPKYEINSNMGAALISLTFLE